MGELFEGQVWNFVILAAKRSTPYQDDLDLKIWCWLLIVILAIFLSQIVIGCSVSIKEAVVRLIAFWFGSFFGYYLFYCLVCYMSDKSKTVFTSSEVMEVFSICFLDAIYMISIVGFASGDFSEGFKDFIATWILLPALWFGIPVIFCLSIAFLGSFSMASILFPLIGIPYIVCHLLI